jgi:NTP pyrophosphatase (non-canonical NTP hydrolase)
MTNYINWEKLELLSEIDKDVSIDDKAHKLGEEVGEFYQALLKYKGANNVSRSADTPEGQEKLNVLEELCDTLNVTLDLINSLEFSQDEVSTMFDKKLGKWGSKAIGYSEDEVLKKKLMRIL